MVLLLKNNSFRNLNKCSNCLGSSAFLIMDIHNSGDPITRILLVPGISIRTFKILYAMLVPLTQMSRGPSYLWNCSGTQCSWTPTPGISAVHHLFRPPSPLSFSANFTLSCIHTVVVSSINTLSQFFCRKDRVERTVTFTFTVINFWVSRRQSLSFCRVPRSRILTMTSRHWRINYSLEGKTKSFPWRT